MQSQSIRKFSILGLVLMGVSAITAAIMPSKTKHNGEINGLLMQSSTDHFNPYDVTCREAIGAEWPDCDYTATWYGTIVSGTGPIDSYTVGGHATNSMTTLIY